MVPGSNVAVDAVVVVVAVVDTSELDCM